MGRFSAIEDMIRAMRRGPPDVPPATAQPPKVIVAPGEQARARAYSSMRDSWPIEYEADAEDLMHPEVLGSLHPAQQQFLQELGNNDWLGFDYPSQAASAALGRNFGNWEMSPELLRARQALIDSHAAKLAPSAAPAEVAVRMPGEFDLTNVHGRPLNESTSAPGWPAGVSSWAEGPRVEPGVRATPDFSLGSPLFQDMASSADATSPSRLRQRANVIPGGRRGDPNPAGDLKRIAAQNIDEARAAREAEARPPVGGEALARDLAKAGVAAGVAAGTGVMVAPKDMGLTESGNPAELKEDPIRPDLVEDVAMGMSPADLMAPVPSAPKPEAAKSVPAKPAPVASPSPASGAALAPAATEPADHSLEARKLIDQLNAMRRKAGGEVPEAPAMMKEINRLLAMGDKQRNDPSYKIPAADPARDPYEQARSLVAQVNQMYREGFSQNDPRVQQVMARVRELHAQGDAIRNKGVYR